MVFNAPDGIEAHFVRQHDLRDVLLVDPALGHALAPRMVPVPRLRYIEFVKQPKVHGILSIRAVDQALPTCHDR